MISETQHPSPRPFPLCDLQESPRPLWAPRPALRSSHKRASTPPSSPDPSHIGDGPSEGSVPDLRVRNSSDGGPTRAAHHWSHWRDGEQVGNAPVPVPAPPGSDSGEECLLTQTTAWRGAQGPRGNPQQLWVRDTGGSPTHVPLRHPTRDISTPHTDLCHSPPSWAARANVTRAQRVWFLRFPGSVPARGGGYQDSRPFYR